MRLAAGRTTPPGKTNDLKGTNAMSYFKKLAAKIVGVVLVSLSALGTAKATEPAQDEELA